MTALHPTFKLTEDVIVHGGENLLADGRAVKQCPTPNHRVENRYKLLYRCMEISPNGSFDFGKEVLNILAGRFDEELAIVLPDVTAEKIKPIVDVSDARFAL